MNLILIRSEYDEAYAHFTPLDDGLRPCTTHPYLTTIRHIARDPSLILVGREGVHNLSLASWIFRPSEAQVPVVQRLLTIRDIHAVWPSDLPAPHLLRQRLLPHAEFQELRRQTRLRDESEARSRKHDTYEAKKSAASRLRRMGLTREAEDLRSGATPFALPTAASRENWFSLIRNRSAQ